MVAASAERPDPPVQHSPEARCVSAPTESRRSSVLSLTILSDETPDYGPGSAGTQQRAADAAGAARSKPTRRESAPTAHFSLDLGDPLRPSVLLLRHGAILRPTAGR